MISKDVAEVKEAAVPDRRREQFFAKQLVELGAAFLLAHVYVEMRAWEDAERARRHELEGRGDPPRDALDLSLDGKMTGVTAEKAGFIVRCYLQTAMEIAVLCAAIKYLLS